MDFCEDNVFLERAVSMSLSIRDVLLIDFFNGKPVHAKIPEFEKSVYGKDGESRIHDLCDEGWIRHSRPQETVNMLPDQALSDFLKCHGLSGEGAHVELVRRVIESIPEEEYAHAVPKVFIATADGQNEIAHNMAYILNVRGQYGFTEGEIGEAQRKLSSRPSFTANDVLLEAFHLKHNLLVMAGEWSKLRNLFFTEANFFIRIGDKDQALSYFSLVFFIDLSGMENRNHLRRYRELFATQQGIIALMDQLRREKGMDDRAMRSYFLSSIARLAPRLPFSYFSPQIMAGLLIDRFRGQKFIPERYEAYANEPDSTAGAYHYTSHKDRLSEKEKAPISFPPPSLPKISFKERLPLPTPVFTPTPPFRQKSAVTKKEHDEEEKVSLKEAIASKKKKNLFTYLSQMLSRKDNDD